VSGQPGERDLDAELAVATAATAVQVAIRTATRTGCVVPEWARPVAGLLQDWSGQLERGGWAAGQAGTAGTAGMPQGASLGTAVLAYAVVPAAPLPTHPLLTWLRLRWGVRRCLACGRLGQGSLQPANLLVPPQLARTWRCVDRLACRTRRLRRSDPR
jgi:hypothetical protein